MIVIDASAFVEVVLNRLTAVDALRAEPKMATDTMHAPEVIELEVLQALRRLLRWGDIDEARAEAALGNLATADLRRHPHEPLRDRVWELRDELTAYDASYLALAETLDDPLLVTGDGGLAARARRSLGADAVRELV